MYYNIAIIGAGVSGITTAYIIQQELKSFVNVTIFTKDISPNTTGDVAAGVISPYIWDNMVEDEAAKWTRATLAFYHDLWKKGYAKEAGISLIPMLKLTSSDKAFDVSILFKATLGCVRVSEDYLQKLSKHHNSNYINGVHFTTLTCEPSKFLPFLQTRFLENGGVIKMQEVKNFEELSDFDLIVNCTGVHARYLTDDERIRPIRGQVVRVKAPWQYHGVLSGSHYVIPNIETSVLGGTEQYGDYNLNVDERDKQDILNFCYNMFPSLKAAEIEMHRVGLRPGRDKVRVELEERQCGNKVLKIVHNYGHSGNGITLSVGCAEEAAGLVKRVLQVNVSSKL